MSVDARAEIVIERPRKDVAEVMFEPKYDKLWITGLTNCFPQSPGLMHPGLKFERIGTLLGRHYSCQYIVSRSDGESFAEFAADEPFQMKVRYELSDADGGTTTKIRIQSIGEHEYKLPAPALNRAIAEWLAGDLKRLKKRVEDGVD
ncbi:MAG: SRPBCC family protein [Acidobacteria bacterium]|nr:SRPBCC family protein [Acidobacteriota bacterium]